MEQAFYSLLQKSWSALVAGKLSVFFQYVFRVDYPRELILYCCYSTTQADLSWVNVVITSALLQIGGMFWIRPSYNKLAGVVIFDLQ